MLILFVCYFSTSSIRITILKDAQFVPSNTSCKLADLSNINSQDECACQYVTNSRCLTATYYGLNRSCSLFSTSIRQNWLRKMAAVQNISVLTFTNGTLQACSIFDFQQPPDLRGTGSTPTGMISADINMDGHLDLVISNYYTNTVSVFFGIGNGSFEVGVANVSTNGNSPYCLVANDFNYDGNIDLAVCNQASNTIAILLGFGNGSFRLSTTPFPSDGSTPTSITVADVNNDTYTDLIVINTASNGTTIFLGYGNGTFELPRTSYIAVPSPTSVASGDFNSDRNIDLAIVSQGSNKLFILLGVSDGTFRANASSYTTGVLPYVVRTADFNGDSILDIVVVNLGSNSINIFINNGLGIFILPSPSTYTTNLAHPSDIAIQDLNADSILDLAVSHQSGNILVYIGYGNGTFNGSKSYLSGGIMLQAIVAGDFDEDGLYDLAIINRNSNNLAVLLASCD